MFFHFYFLFDDLILSKELDTSKKQVLEMVLDKVQNFIHEIIIIFWYFQPSFNLFTCIAWIRIEFCFCFLLQSSTLKNCIVLSNFFKDVLCNVKHVLYDITVTAEFAYTNHYFFAFNPSLSSRNMGIWAQASSEQGAAQCRP